MFLLFIAEDWYIKDLLQIFGLCQPLPHQHRFLPPPVFMLCSCATPAHGPDNPVPQCTLTQPGSSGLVGVKSKNWNRLQKEP